MVISTCEPGVVVRRTDVLRRKPSRAVTAGTLLAAALLVGGCSSSSSGATAGGTASGAGTTPAPAATTASVGTSSAPATTSSAPAPSTSSAVASGSGAASGVPRCSFGQLTFRLGQSDGAAGSIYQPVVFHNTGAPCWLDGHPGMDATGPGGTVHAGRDGRSSTGSATVRRVVLARGGDASALVRASDVPSGSATTCPGDFTSVLVTPPDLRTSARLTAHLPACPGLTIGPVVPGTAG